MIVFIFYSGLLTTSNILSFAGLLLLAILLLDTFIFNITGIKDWFYFTFKKTILLTEEEKKEASEYLTQIPYFKSLSTQGKERFIQRCYYITKRLHFSSSEVFELDLKSRILIASAIAQLTFGLKNYYIYTIRHIRVFQKEILNPRTKQRFYGLMFTSGKMYLSWERFEKGIRISDDGINLGLHETTHGLLILLKHHKLNYEEFESMIDWWYQLAEKEIISKENKNGFIREYASANKDEFFSVIIENFFERPDELKTKLPDLYEEICVYLNQDPLNAINDYRLTTDPEIYAEPSARHPFALKQLNLVKDKWHWSFTLMVLAGYFSYVVNLILKNYLASSFSTLFIAYLLLFPLVYFLLKKPLVSSGRLSKRNYFIITFFSLSPLALILIVTLNILIPVGKTKTEKYTITATHEGKGLLINDGDLSYIDKETYYCELNSDNSFSIAARGLEELPEQDTLIIFYHYGITGLKVLEGNNSGSGKDEIFQNR